MNLKINKKYLFIFLLVFYLLFLTYRYKHFYDNIFRLSYQQVSESLAQIKPSCTKFKECQFKPGDIIIRRYITTTTNFVDIATNPYFVHSALYLGDDRLFEISGNGETKENQVSVKTFSKSDWFNEDMKNFVILRPTNYQEKFEKISSELKKISDDPDYVFGSLDEKRKRASCADLIFKYLITEKIITWPNNIPGIIVPDYLFWVMVNDKSNVEVIGYNINPKE